MIAMIIMTSQYFGGLHCEDRIKADKWHNYLRNTYLSDAFYLDNADKKGIFMKTVNGTCNLLH